MNWILKTFWELLLLGFSLPSLFKWFWPKESYKICQNQIHFWLHNWLESKNYWLTQSTTNSIMPQGTDPWNYNFTSLFWGITRCLVLVVFPLLLLQHCTHSSLTSLCQFVCIFLSSHLSWLGASWGETCFLLAVFVPSFQQWLTYNRQVVRDRFLFMNNSDRYAKRSETPSWLQRGYHIFVVLVLIVLKQAEWNSSIILLTTLHIWFHKLSEANKVVLFRSLTHICAYGETLCSTWKSPKCLIDHPYKFSTFCAHVLVPTRFHMCIFIFS